MAVYALPRAMSIVAGLASSSRSTTSRVPERSTTATLVWKPRPLHSASAASAMIFAAFSDRIFWVTTP